MTEPMKPGPLPLPSSTVLVDEGPENLWWAFNADQMRAYAAQEVAAAVAVERERFGWRPIESAPKDGTNVLLVNTKGNMATGLWQGAGESEGWWLRGGNRPNVFFNQHHGPTHWMPLPPAPESTP